MISQKCPKCNSSRVRRGYRPTPFFLKCVFRFNLLCDTCNWEFVGFAVPGTLSSKPNKKKKKTISEKVAEDAGAPAEKAEGKSIGKTVNSLF